MAMIYYTSTSTDAPVTANQETSVTGAKLNFYGCVPASLFYGL